jgi:fluoride exporter
MRDVLFVAAGGAIGAALRYGIGIQITARAGEGFPWHTLVINVVGAFLIGVLLALPWVGMGSGAPWRLFLVTGILGGFTTFSTLSYESIELISHGRVFAGLANMFGSGALGLGAAWLGLMTGRIL